MNDRCSPTTANTVVHARIDEAVKQGATEVVSAMGQTVSDAVRILLTKAAREKCLPSDLMPNAVTAETHRESQTGEDVHHVADAEASFKDIDI